MVILSIRCFKGGCTVDEYIRNTDFQVLLQEIQDKLEHKEIEECCKMLNQIMKVSENQGKYIDRTYIGQVKARKRMNRIAEINEMLKKMSMEQINNVHNYTVNEFDEPNHEAEALRAIVTLSRRE